jgi:DNA-3-methyladenine glycosylase II
MLAADWRPVRPKGTKVTTTTEATVTDLCVADLMLDHPSWLVNDDATAYRVMRSAGSVWSVTCVPAAEGGQRVRTVRVDGDGPAPVLDVFDSATVTGQDAIAVALRQAGPVARLRNPDLWDALATAIIRQVIRAGQARKLYRVFCHQHGDPVTTPNGTGWLFPAPQVVLDLPDEEFTHLGMAFKRRPLQAAAQAYLEHGVTWATLPPARLLADVQHVRRIGPWTAGAAVADLSNDFSLYPFADLAVRTWAARLVPDQQWPGTEPEFAAVWQAQAGPQLSAWTLLTLAFGVRHASRTGATAF